MKRKIQNFFIVVLFLIIAFSVYQWASMKYWGYRDFEITRTICKKHLLNDTVLSDIFTVTSEVNRRHDTLIYFSYKEKYIFTFIRINKYSDIKPSNIMKWIPMPLEFEQGTDYYMFAGENDNPILLGLKEKISTPDKLSLVFNDSKNEVEEGLLETGLIYKLKSSSIGILSNNHFPDIIIDPRNPENQITLILARTRYGFFIICGSAILNTDTTKYDLVSFLNPTTFELN